MMTQNTEAFRCEDIHVAIEGKDVVKGVSLTIQPGEIHALMGPNGSGKSTLANALMGHPSYELTGGRIFIAGEDVTDMEPHERSRRGMLGQVVADERADDLAGPGLDPNRVEPAGQQGQQHLVGEHRVVELAVEDRRGHGHPVAKPLEVADVA